MILNYTTKIDPDKTAAEIAKCLSLHGAKAVLTEYDEKEQVVKSLSFKIAYASKEMSFRLPCDWKPIYDIFERDKPIRDKTEQKLQSVRTAWRIVKDWVEAQMALVETNMVTTAQVFLPYAIVKDGHTLAEKIVSNPSFLLEG